MELQGVTKLELLATAIALFSFFFLFSSFGTASGVKGGNWTAVGITYPTNYTNSSTSWLALNFTLNLTVASCKGEVGNYTGYQNITGTVHGSYTCEINITYSKDTWYGHKYNLTLYAYNSDSDVVIANPIVFRIDTNNPTLSHSQAGNITNHTTLTGTFPYTSSEIRMYVTDNSTQTCGVNVYHEVINKTNGALSTELYTSIAGGMKTYGAVSVCSVNLTGNNVAGDYYDGRIIVEPYAIDYMGNTGKTTTNMTYAINHIPASTWTPIGYLHSISQSISPSTNAVTQFGWLWNTTWYGNISYISLWDGSNITIKTFRTHQWNTTTNANVILNTSNNSAFYVFSSVDYALLRTNYTEFENFSNVSLVYNVSANTSQWNLIALYHTNLTKFYNSTSCDGVIDWISYHNVTDTSCVGGCYYTYKIGWGIWNETVLPYGSAVWVHTNYINATLERPTYVNKEPVCHKLV